MRKIVAGIFVIWAAGSSIPAGAQEPLPAPTPGTTAAVLIMDRPGERAKVEAEARDDLGVWDFRGLEKTEEKLRTEQSRFPEGLWKLPIFYSGLDSPLDQSKEGWKKYFAKLDAWQQAKPGSILAATIRGGSLLNYAWVARNSGQADGAQSEKLFTDRLAQARKVLEDAYTAQQGKDMPPSWYTAQLRIGIAQNWAHPEFDRWFDEAVTAYPGYDDFYFTKAYYLWPQENGQSEAVKFAEERGQKERPERYTRIMWALSSYIGDNNFFANTGAKWDLMKPGFEEIEKDWPTSLWNLNAFCHFAVMAKDKPTAKRLFDKIGAQFYGNIWGSPDNFNAAKAWASSPGT